MSSRTFLIKPSAEADMASAYDWYEERRQGLGQDFLMAVEATFEQISRNPNAFKVKYRDVRRVLVNRFPYTILFKTNPDRLVILAVIHERRDPDLFYKRALER